MPRVSVVIPTYNRPVLLYRALISVREQDYKDLEAIVVNDGVVKVEHIVKAFPFARLINNSKNIGLSASRNVGIRAAKGFYLSYLDDDDLWLPFHLSTVLEYLEPLMTVRAAFSDTYHWISEKLLYRARTRGRNVACIINVVHERSVTDEMGGFDETLTEMEDWDFVIRMSRHLGGMWHVPKCTTIYSKRYSPDQMSNDREKMKAAFEIIKERFGIEKEWEKPKQSVL